MKKRNVLDIGFLLAMIIFVVAPTCVEDVDLQPQTHLPIVAKGHRPPVHITPTPPAPDVDQPTPTPRTRPAREVIMCDGEKYPWWMWNETGCVPEPPAPWPTGFPTPEP